MYMYTYIYICICTYMYMYMYTYVYIHTLTHTHTYTGDTLLVAKVTAVKPCSSIYMKIYINTHICICIHIYIYVHTYMYMYTYLYTHTHTLSLSLSHTHTYAGDRLLVAKVTAVKPCSSMVCWCIGFVLQCVAACCKSVAVGCSGLQRVDSLFVYGMLMSRTLVPVCCSVLQECCRVMQCVAVCWQPVRLWYVDV